MNIIMHNFASFVCSLRPWNEHHIYETLFITKVTSELLFPHKGTHRIYQRGAIATSTVGPGYSYFNKTYQKFGFLCWPSFELNYNKY